MILPEFFEKRKALILDSICALVEIESPSFDISGSGRAADLIERIAQSTSCVDSVKRIAVAGVGEHLIIRAFERQKPKQILLLGHTDTVHPIGSKEKNPTRIEGGRIYGCGVFDMKANCILMLEMLRAFDELNIAPARPVTILLSCDEETGSASGRALVEREAQSSEYCLVCEPSAAGRVKTGRKGTGMFRVKARGVPAHAGLEPEKGASAILELSHQIEKIHSLNDPSKGTSANVCQISGGTASNVIPAEAECSIDIRFTSVDEAARIENAIRNFKPVDTRVALEVTGAINRPPLERTAAVVSLYERACAVAGSFSYKLGETQVGGASDGNFTAAAGVPTLDGLGVTGDGAHTLHEYVSISDISRRAALVSGLIVSL
jgi:glutamate carboxypeptidase